MTISSYSLNGKMGLKMKWLPKNIMVFMALVVTASPALAQTLATPASSTSNSAPGTAPGDAPKPDNTVELTMPKAADSSTTSGNAAPVPTIKEAVPWTTGALRTALAESVNEMVKKSQKEERKKTKLPESKIKSLRSKIVKNENDEKSRIQLAEHFEAVGKHQEAIDILRPQISKLNRAGILALARAYRAQKNHLQEIRTLEIQASNTPSDYVVQYLIGQAYASLGKKDEAFRYFSEARRLNSNFLPAYEAILREDKKSGQIHDAVTIAQDMQSTFGDTATTLNELCLLYAHEAFHDKAVETCRQAIEKSPKFANNHVVLGLVVKEKEGIAPAAKILEKAAKQFPKSEFAQYVAGELNWERKNTYAALEYFAKAVKANDKSARAHLGVGRAAFEERKYDKALNGFVQACLLDRTLIADFRKSAGLLRKKNDLTWAGRYNSGLGRCGMR